MAVEMIMGDASKNFPDEIHRMYQLRHQVFKERLDWDVQSENGEERDDYDDLNPAYLLYRDHQGEIKGGLRLLKTTGPYMLTHTFSELLEGNSAPHSEKIWESTRFSVDTTDGRGGDRKKIHRATSELLCGILEFGIATGLTEIVSVFDVYMERVLKRAGWAPTRIGVPKKIGDVMTVAGLFEVSTRCLINVRETGGIEEPVLRFGSIH